MSDRKKFDYCALGFSFCFRWVLSGTDSTALLLYIVRNLHIIRSAVICGGRALW